MRQLADVFMRHVEGRTELPEGGIARRIDGMTHWFAGDVPNARLHLERALADYDSVRDRGLANRFGQDLAVPAMAYLAMTLWPLGMCDDAERLVEKTIEHALRTEHVPTIAYAYLHGAFFEMMRRDHLRCHPHVRVYLDLAREHMMPLWLANGAFHEGWVRWHTGDRDAGRSQMHGGLALLREQGQSLYLPLLGALLAETEAEEGRHETALATVDAELARMRETGQCWFLAEAHRVRGEVVLRSHDGDVEAAEAAFTQAIEVARGQSARQFERQAANSLARLWADRGRNGRPHGLLAILGDGRAERPT